MNTVPEFLRETVDLVKQIETRFIELGLRLHKIKYEKLWSETYDSYQEFLQTARISDSSASVLTAIVQKYLVEGGKTPEDLEDTGYSNLYEAIPLIERDGVDLALEKAKTLSRNEIQAEKVFQKTGHECTHEKQVTICAGCHKRIS